MPVGSSTAGDWRPGGADTEPSSAERASDAGDRFPEDVAELPLDETFELLKNYRRRIVLEYLDENPSTTLSTLAEYVAAQENEKSISALSSAERKRVYISLYQCHLPKLDDAAVIDFDSDRGTVERNPHADYLVPYLQLAAGDSSEGSGVPWHYYYLGIAIAGGFLLAVQLALIPTLLASTAVALAMALTFSGVALVHARRRI